MTSRFVALLRGINVGKAKQVDMAALREVFASLGALEVRTHLRSGNVVYGAGSKAPATKSSALEQAIEAATGVSCSVVVLTADSLRAVVEADPLGAVATDPSKYLVTFLSSAPSAAVVTAFEQTVVAPNQAVVGKDAIYLWCPDGVLAATGDAKFWQRHGIVATSRNWRTVIRLVDLSAA